MQFKKAVKKFKKAAMQFKKPQVRIKKAEARIKQIKIVIRVANKAIFCECRHLLHVAMYIFLTFILCSLHENVIHVSKSVFNNTSIPTW